LPSCIPATLKVLLGPMLLSMPSELDALLETL
jgi:hypothetical protein